MARQVKTEVSARVRAWEIQTNPGGVGTQPSRLLHELVYDAEWPSGTADGEADRVWSFATTSLDTTGTELDLIGGTNMLSRLDTTNVNSFVNLTLLAAKNTSASGDMQIGGGSNAVVGIVLASGDVIPVKPGGLLLWVAPGGISPVAGTGDILKVAASTGTIDAEMMVVGRSA